MSSRPGEILASQSRQEAAPPWLGAPDAPLCEKRERFERLSLVLAGDKATQTPHPRAEPGITEEWIGAMKAEFGQDLPRDQRPATPAAGKPELPSEAERLDKSARRLYLFLARRELAALNGADDLSTADVHDSATTITRRFSLAYGSKDAGKFAEGREAAFDAMTRASFRSVHTGLATLETSGASLGYEATTATRTRVREHLADLRTGNLSPRNLFALAKCEDRLKTPRQPSRPAARVVEPERHASPPRKLELENPFQFGASNYVN